MKRKTFILVFVLYLFIFQWAMNGESAEKKMLNFGWTSGSIWTALPFNLAAERGFFDKEGLKVRFIQFQGTNLMLTALLSGEVDAVGILPFIAGAAVRGLPVKIVAAATKASGYAIISKPGIGSLRDLKGKRIAINSFGSSADFAVYKALSRVGLDPNKDVTLAAISGSPDARFAALMGGSVDATVVNSPLEYRAEQKGFKTLVSVREMAEFVKIPLTGVSVSRKKIEREPEDIVRLLRALRAGILFFQNHRDISVALMEKTLQLDRVGAEKFYPQYRDQYNPDLTVPDSVVEEWIAVGVFRAKEQEKKVIKPQVVYDWTLAEKAK